MGYYRARYRRAPPKHRFLVRLFGSAVDDILQAFQNLDEDDLDGLLSDYGAIYGDSAEEYARRTYPKWNTGRISLSGKTMGRLVELVPPYLSAKERFTILQTVLKHNRKAGVARTIKVNVKEPDQGFAELHQVLSEMSHDDVLAHLPENVMNAASWLYADDITTARAMLAEAERLENDMIRSSAKREIELLRRTISTGQVKAASYSVEMPAGGLNVVAYSPSMCFVATVCFGADAPETALLRVWRDRYLIEQDWGRQFIVWYYNNGEQLAKLASSFPALNCLAKVVIGAIARLAAHQLNRGEK